MLTCPCTRCVSCESARQRTRSCPPLVQLKTTTTMPASPTTPSSIVTMPRRTRPSRFMRGADGSKGCRTSVRLADGEVQHEPAEEGLVARTKAARRIEWNEHASSVANVRGDHEEILDEPGVIPEVDAHRADRRVVANARSRSDGGRRARDVGDVPKISETLQLARADDRAVDEHSAGELVCQRDAELDAAREQRRATHWPRMKLRVGERADIGIALRDRNRRIAGVLRHAPVDR